MEIVNYQLSGLGNQLFQYAAGVYYGRQLQAPVRLATDPAHRANSYGLPRPFLLSRYRISTPYAEASAADRLMLSTRPWLAPALHLLRRTLGIQVVAERRENRFTFPGAIRLEPGTRRLYLAGYWQCYAIPDAIKATLRADLTLREEPQGKNREMMARIAQARHPVSLHVRRGDYALQVEGNRVLSMDYYAEAIHRLRERVADPKDLTFFVFSDDIPFTRANLPGGAAMIFVDHNDDASSHEDMRLMSACHHHVIANSSFSWWGAWLNPRPDKLVIAPRHWLLTPESYYPELLPPSWMLLESARSKE